jgi:hypothetical protein
MSRNLQADSEADRAGASDRVIANIRTGHRPGRSTRDVRPDAQRAACLSVLRLRSFNLFNASDRLSQVLDPAKLTELSFLDCESEISLLRKMINPEGKCAQLRRLEIIRSECWAHYSRGSVVDDTFNQCLMSFQTLESLVLQQPWEGP